jgi:hypothetical protein
MTVPVGFTDIPRCNGAERGHRKAGPRFVSHNEYKDIRREAQWSTASYAEAKVYYPFYIRGK